MMWGDDMTCQNHSPHFNGIVDLHGMHRWKAKKVLIGMIFSLVVRGKQSLLVIHGYHHGTVLRDYIRGGRFIADLRKEYPLLPYVSIIEYRPGATKIRIAKRRECMEN